MTRTTTLPLAVGLKAAAEMAGVSADTIRRAIHSEEPPYLKAKKIGGRISIAVKDLQAWHDSLPDA
ncbi:MAG: hypothetical protein BGO26_10100 [Actinobacteria bacterium 69-20]|nr:helix-turn-helix domain-containing protein [Actinomycetota bacterium]OJV23250.1 MAG: hypothetical protein BGO26_10100 [Actinobacteria bacterium 69-20]